MSFAAQKTATAFFPRTTRVNAVLDKSPRYAGSSHDDETARRMGFRAALIPGAFVYGYASRIAVDSWGMDWISRGTIHTRFRRPVFNGDVLIVSALELSEDEDGVRSEVTVTNQDNEAVLVGWIGLPHRVATPPPVSELPVRPMPDPPIALVAGGMAVGTRVGSKSAILTEEALRESRAAFNETHPIYVTEDIAHSGCLMRLTMGDTLQTFKLPSPPIFAWGDAQHYAPVRPGRRMSTSGVITANYERKGNHYFDAEEYLIADGKEVVARFRRCNLYAMGSKPE